MLKTGKVYIIGIGPGDSNLVTLRARELIEIADIIIYDYIVDSKILEWPREDAKTICVGKTAEQNALPKDEVQELLIRNAKMGHTVTRLKNGDPSVFERDGNEIKEKKSFKMLF